MTFQEYKREKLKDEKFAKAYEEMKLEMKTALVKGGSDEEVYMRHNNRDSANVLNSACIRLHRFIHHDSRL